MSDDQTRRDRRFRLLTLRTRQEFHRVETRGRRDVSRFYVLLHARRDLEGPGADPSVSRLGTDDSTVSRVAFKCSKRLGKAVTRNRIRRRLREICRSWFPKLRVPVDVILIPRAAASSATFQDLEQDFKGLLRRARLLPRPSRSRRSRPGPKRPPGSPAPRTDSGS